jgi:hypothetical protein
MPLSTTSSDVKAITSASVTFDTTMQSGVQYLLRTDTALWYRISSASTAAQANTDENHYVPAGGSALVAANGAANKITAIRAAVDGNASLSELRGVS